MCARMHVCVWSAQVEKNANEGESQAGEATQREKVTKVLFYIRRRVLAATAESRSQ